MVLNNFDRDVTEYYYKSTFSSDEITVTALAEDAGAIVKVNGPLKFVDNRVVARITVTAPSGSEKTYVITIEKEVIVDNEGEKNVEPPEIKVDDLIKNIDIKINGDIFYGISPGTDISFIIGKISSQGGSAVINNADNNNKSSGVINTLDKVVISGTKESRTYNIAIRGDINGDGDITVLDLLKCQKHLLGSTKLTGTQFYAADTNYDNELTILDLLKIQKHILGSSKL